YRRPPIHAHGMAHVVHQAFPSHEAPHIAAVLLRDGDVPHLPAAQLDRRLQGNTGTRVLRPFLLEMEVDLFCELPRALVAPPADQDTVPPASHARLDRSGHAMSRTL